MAGFSLQEIRQFAAREAGKFYVSTATSGTVSELVDTAWPVNSSIAASGTYKDYWLYRPGALAAGDKVRYVKTYTGTGGKLDPDTNWTNAPTNGEAYELHGMFPPVGNANSSWLTLINDGLKSCLVPIEYSFNPANSTDSRFSLATVAAWLTDPWLVRKVGVLSGGVSRSANDPYVIRPLTGAAICELDGVTVYLNAYPMTFATTDTIYLTILTPAYYAIQANGVGSFTQTGMALETDVAPLDNVELGAYAALVEGWRRFGQVLDMSGGAPRSVNSLVDAVAKFNEFSPEYDMRIPMQMRRIRHWGPSRHVGYVSGWSRG
jgi:hypothetical protein